MAKKKRTSDVNVLSSKIITEATQESQEQLQALAKEKNPAALALGRLGGLKGGPARAEKLSKKYRIKIARKAAMARWVGKKIK